MKKKSKVYIIVGAIIVLVFVGLILFNYFHESKKDWGSFTARKTYSYDQKYYAKQAVVLESDQVHYVKVTIFNAKTNQEVYSFIPARAMDFWGICWEKDSYNIWTQSSDIGIYCYQFKGGKWLLNEDAKMPSYIQSKEVGQGNG